MSKTIDNGKINRLLSYYYTHCITNDQKQNFQVLAEYSRFMEILNPQELKEYNYKRRLIDKKSKILCAFLQVEVLRRRCYELNISHFYNCIYNICQYKDKKYIAVYVPKNLHKYFSYKSKVYNLNCNVFFNHLNDLLCASFNDYYNAKIFALEAECFLRKNKVFKFINNDVKKAIAFLKADYLINMPKFKKMNFQPAITDISEKEKEIIKTSMQQYINLIINYY